MDPNTLFPMKTKIHPYVTNENWTWSPKKRVYARLRGIGYRELSLDKRRKVESQWAAPAWFVEETIKMMVDKLLQNLNLFPTALPLKACDT